MQELLDKCHPLGMFDSIATLAVASSMRELYRLVLVDTPLAPYFSESLSAGRQPHRSCGSHARVCFWLADMKQGVDNMDICPAEKTCCCWRGQTGCCLQLTACLIACEHQNHITRPFQPLACLLTGGSAPCKRWT